jgi:DNA end-binding protein Ku
MAARPTWEGHLRLSLVTCPIRLFKAVGEGDQVHFNLLHRETLNRVRQAWKDPGDGIVERKDLVRGYQVEKDRYVVVEDEELQKLKLDSTKVIDIERFVDAREIDRLYWDEPYYLVPDGKPAQDAYAVIREAMRGEHQVALGRLVIASRERIVAVEARGKGMLLSTLHSHDEVRSEDEAFEAIAEVKIDRRMVEIATQIIAQAKGRFDPAEFQDRYKDAVRALVASKVEGDTPVHRPGPSPSESNVIDLMEALRRSLKASPGKEAARDAAPPRPTRPAAKKAGAAKAGGSGERRASPPRKGGTHAPRRAAG